MGIFTNKDGGLGCDVPIFGVLPTLFEFGVLQKVQRRTLKKKSFAPNGENVETNH